MGRIGCIRLDYKGTKREKKIDGISKTEEIIARYEILDNVFCEVQKKGRFNSSFKPNIHIGVNGKLYFGHGGGHYRVCIAYILGIPFQARLGLIHKTGLTKLYEIRKRKVSNL